MLSKKAQLQDSVIDQVPAQCLSGPAPFKRLGSFNVQSRRAFHKDVNEQHSVYDLNHHFRAS